MRPPRPFSKTVIHVQWRYTYGDPIALSFFGKDVAFNERPNTSGGMRTVEDIEAYLARERRAILRVPGNGHHNLSQTLYPVVWTPLR